MAKVRAYPNELADAQWQKKKSITAGETGIGGKLKELAKAYSAVQWSRFEGLEKVVSKQQFDKEFPPAVEELEKVKAFTDLCFEFRDFAKSKAATMKALTNKGTKKLLEEMSDLSHELGDELLSDCKQRLETVRESKVIAEYPQRLQAWIERKNNQLKVFKNAKVEFEEHLKSAREIASQSDDFAKNMPGETEAAKRVLKSLADNAVQISDIQKKMKSQFEKYFKMFEPHRSSPEKPETHQLDPKDTEAQKGVFTEADNLRKELESLQSSVAQVFQETIDSAKEAQAAVLRGSSQSAAYLKIANDLVKTYGTIGDKIKHAFIAKSILGDKSVAYRDGWMSTFFRGIEDVKDKGEQANLIQQGKVRAQQRRDQVDELEVQLKKVYEAAKLAIEKVEKGIPVDARKGEIAEKLEIVHKSLDQGKDYVEKWVEENKAAHITYDETMEKLKKYL